MEDIYSDGDSIWVASPTSGLFRFDPETSNFTHHYTEKNGLASNTVVGVLGDAQGNVWVSTVKGLSKFDPRTETFRNYDMFDGLQGDEFSPHCRAKAPDGRLFFGGINGLSAFYPDKLVDNPTPPPVVLTAFELFNKPVKVGGKNSPLQQAINVASSITLRYDQSVFGFQFAALNYTSPQKNSYAYKLDDFDRDWQYTDATRRFATYTHLDHGDDTFRVKASNNDGVWNEAGGFAPPSGSLRHGGKRAGSACLRGHFSGIALGSLPVSRPATAPAQFTVTLEGALAERTSIARELHDTLLQSFHGLLPRFQVVSSTAGTSAWRQRSSWTKPLPRRQGDRRRAGRGAGFTRFHGPDERPSSWHSMQLVRNWEEMQPTREPQHSA